MRFLVRFSFALIAALALGMLYPTTQMAQVSKRHGKLAPSLTPAAATNYQIAETTGALVPGTTQVPVTNCPSGVPGDDCIATVALPFSFTLYDTPFSAVNVNSNGNAQFASNVATFPLDACLPISAYSYTIYAHHADLTIGGTNEGIFTSVSGSAPNRIFNIEWRASLIGNAPGSLDFELRLYEGQDRFDVVYGTVPGAGREATVGVQQGTGATFTEFECFGSNTLRNGQTLVFTGTSDATRFITGRVTDPDGNPIAGVTVSLSGAATAQLITDGTGTYAFTGLTAGSTYTVTATQTGFNFVPVSRTFGGAGNRAFNGNFIVDFIRTVPPNPGEILISEFRFRGQAFGAIDEFIEVLNNTDRAITVNVTDGSSGWLVQAARVAPTPMPSPSPSPTPGPPPLASFIIPNGTTIPAHGHYLAGNGNGYNLFSYANADTFLALGADIPDDGGIALFNTSNAAALDAAHRLDAVGFSGEPNALYREGAGLASPGANNGNYSFVRKLTSGRAQDTDNNASDFVFVAPDGGSYGGVQATLGAPGPESTTSPIERNAQVKGGLIDPQQASTAAPNRVRDQTAVTNGALGTLTIRRKFTNATGTSITRLRFRIVDITTKPAPAGIADLRALNSNSSTVPVTGGGTVQVSGLTVEQGTGTITIAQPQGGGLNTSLGVGAITVAQPLAPNNSINVEFRLGVQQGGTYRFFINIEALP